MPLCGGTMCSSGYGVGKRSERWLVVLWEILCIYLAWLSVVPVRLGPCIGQSQALRHNPGKQVVGGVGGGKYSTFMISLCCILCCTDSSPVGCPSLFLSVVRAHPSHFCVRLGRQIHASPLQRAASNSRCQSKQLGS